MAGCLFYATSSFVHHSVTISQFKLEVLSGNGQFGSKSVIFFVPCDLKIWLVTLKNNGPFYICYFKLCASSHSYSPETPNSRKIHNFFLSCVTFKFDKMILKNNKHLLYAALSFGHHFIAICDFKLELQSRNAQFRSKSAIICPVGSWNLMDDLEK